MVSKITIKAVTVALGLTLGLTACGSVSEVPTKAEARIQLEKAPNKVVVQDLALLDVLHSLNIPVSGVPDARFPEHLSQYAQDFYVKTGSLFEPDAAVLTELQPDLILLGRRAAKHQEAIAQIAPTVDLSFDQQNLIQSTHQIVRELAALYQRQEIAEPLLLQLRHSVEQLQVLTEQAGPALVLLTTQGKMIAQGPDSRYAVLFNDYGVQPVAGLDFPEGKGVALSAEQIAALNPEWIYVIDRDAGVNREGAVPAQELLKEAALRHVPAIIEQRVVYLNPTNWYLLDGAGLSTLQANIDQMIQALQQAN